MCTIFNKPIIDVEATASKIKSHRIKAGFTVKQIQSIFNFNSPQAIYSWENGSYLPTIDNLIVLSSIYGITVDTDCAANSEPCKSVVAVNVIYA